MQTLVIPVAFTAAVAAVANTAFAGDLQMANVFTHPSQGEKTMVVDATARMATTDGGVFVNFETRGLTPGHVHTMWFVVANWPDLCETAPCTSKDILKRTDIVNADAGYGGGLIVGEDGTASFNWYQPEGALTNGWFGNGMIDAEAAEVHLVINDHGPAIDGRVDDMLTSYRDGCTDASIPGPMPAAARADGMAGPNQCRLVQFTIFDVAEPTS